MWIKRHPRKEAMDKSNLIAAIKKRALLFGDFTLRGGAKSDHYLDCRKLTLSADLPLVTEAIEEQTRGVEFHAIGGPCIGADPLVGAFLQATSARNPLISVRDIRGFLIRKEEKDHGIDGLIIGSVQKGDQCIILEDVATTGGSLLRAINVIEAFGCKVVKVIVIVDRLQGAGEKLKERGIPFAALTTVKEVLEA